MTASKWTLAALAAALAIGFTGAAEAAKTKPVQGKQVGNFYVAAGDNRASIQRAYPIDANPPSLRQSYNLRWRKMQEMRH
jgi:hypothetical protein